MGSVQRRAQDTGKGTALPDLVSRTFLRVRQIFKKLNIICILLRVE